MNKESMKLYDSLTGLDERYLLEAEEFRPRTRKVLPFRPAAWAGLAAAVVLAVGVGTIMPSLNYKSDMFAADSQVMTEEQTSSTTNGSPELGALEDSVHGDSKQEAGTQIRLKDGVYVILEEISVEQGDRLEVVTYLEWKDGYYSPVDSPAESALCAGAGEELFFREDTHYYAVKVKQ